LGTAYQIFDDCLDFFGSEAIVGKSLGTDLATGKLTLPLLIVLENGTAADQTQLRDWIEHWNGESFPQVIEMLVRYEVQDQSREVIYEFLTTARRSLEPLPATTSRRALAAMTEFLAQQADSLGADN